MASSALFEKVLTTFNENELAQEALEGAMGGGLAGLALLGTDTPLQSVGLQTGAAMLGGAGIGILGSHLGAAIGKAVHKNKLKNQNGVLATLGRAFGSKTLTQGGQEIMKQGKGVIKKELVEMTSRDMLEEAMRDPRLFASKYGISADEFQAMMPLVNQGRTVQATLETYANLPKEMQAQLKDKLMQSYGRVENAAAKNAADKMDEILARGQSTLGNIKEMNSAVGPLADFMEGLQQPTTPVTGEHIGRAVGRFIGDEIGVVAGMNLGRMAAEQMGIKTEKDKQLEEKNEMIQELQSRYGVNPALRQNTSSLPIPK